MRQVAALLHCGVDYQSALTMDSRQALILVEEWVKIHKRE
jgi:hypothetical protein